MMNYSSSDLVGRVVGHYEFHKVDPVNDYRLRDRTGWVRVVGEHRDDPNLLVVENIHTHVRGLLRRSDIHTLMTKSY